MEGNGVKEPRKPIDIYKAIEEMRAISAAGGTFSMKFRTWDRARRKGGELIEVRRARLRPRAADDVVSCSQYKLFFTDTETGRARNCWQCLVMEFNGRPTVLA